MVGEYSRTTNGRVSDSNPSTEYPYCPECDVASRPENGELVCPECMVVVQDKHLDLSRARYTRTNTEEGESTVQSVTTRTRHDRGLGSSITSTYGTVQGTADHDLERAQRWWSTHSQDQSLQIGNNEIKRVSAALNLPQAVREEASRLFYIATVEENLLKGRSIELVAAGCVYTAAYLNRAPRTPGEVANELRCETNDVHDGHKLVAGQTYVSQFLPKAVDYLPRFTQALNDETGLDLQHITDLRSTAHHLISQTHSEQTSPSARVLAASALYAAAQTRGISVTQDDVAEVTGVDKATISRHYKTLLNTAS